MPPNRKHLKRSRFGIAGDASAAFFIIVLALWGLGHFASLVFNTQPQNDRFSSIEINEGVVDFEFNEKYGLGRRLPSAGDPTMVFYSGPSGGESQGWPYPFWNHFGVAGYDDPWSQSSGVETIIERVWEIQDWLLALVAGALVRLFVAVPLFELRRWRRCYRPGCCVYCGYDMRGNPGTCSECGEPAAPPIPWPGYFAYVFPLSACLARWSGRFMDVGRAPRTPTTRGRRAFYVAWLTWTTIPVFCLFGGDIYLYRRGLGLSRGNFAWYLAAVKGYPIVCPFAFWLSIAGLVVAVAALRSARWLRHVRPALPVDCRCDVDNSNLVSAVRLAVSGPAGDCNAGRKGHAQCRAGIIDSSAIRQ